MDKKLYKKVNNFLLSQRQNLLDIKDKKASSEQMHEFLFGLMRLVYGTNIKMQISDLNKNTKSGYTTIGLFTTVMDIPLIVFDLTAFGKALQNGDLSTNLMILFHEGNHFAHFIKKDKDKTEEEKNFPNYFTIQEEDLCYMHFELLTIDPDFVKKNLTNKAYYNDKLLSAVHLYHLDLRLEREARMNSYAHTKELLQMIQNILRVGIPEEDEIIDTWINNQLLNANIVMNEYNGYKFAKMDGQDIINKLNDFKSLVNTYTLCDKLDSVRSDFDFLESKRWFIDRNEMAQDAGDSDELVLVSKRKEKIVDMTQISWIMENSYYQLFSNISESTLIATYQKRYAIEDNSREINALARVIVDKKQLVPYILDAMQNDLDIPRPTILWNDLTSKQIKTMIKYAVKNNYWLTVRDILWNKNSPKYQAFRNTLLRACKKKSKKYFASAMAKSGKRTHDDIIEIMYHDIYKVVSDIEKKTLVENALAQYCERFNKLIVEGEDGQVEVKKGIGKLYQEFGIEDVPLEVVTGKTESEIQEFEQRKQQELLKKQEEETKTPVESTTTGENSGFNPANYYLRGDKTTFREKILGKSESAEEKEPETPASNDVFSQLRALKAKLNKTNTTNDPDTNKDQKTEDKK